MSRPDGADGTLGADSSSLEQGARITFSYSVPQPKVNAKNWIGLFPRGQEPVDGRKVGQYAAWEYAPAASGEVGFGTGQVKPGEYVACYLYDDGYASLAEPVRFTVRAVPPMPPPGYAGEFGRTGRAPGRLDRPAGLAVDGRGLLWVADSGNNRVQQFTPDGRLRWVLDAGSLNEPQAVAVDGGGNVFVADTGHNRIVEFAWWGGFLREFGVGELDNPRGVAVAGGQLLATDTGHERVLRFDLRTGKPAGEITAKMSGPQGIAVADDGGVWVVQNGIRDSGRNGIVRYSPAGEPTTTVGYGQYSRFGGLSNPAQVALDPAGRLYVTVPDYGWVAQFRTGGPFLNEFGTEGRGLLRFPIGVALDARGRVFVADTGNDRIVQFGVKR
ncbi:NHL repeat-containing protein [Amycolatopsis nigrescens]|uniref:NHL repeat-containing protein n=1 Tax=Amycolatopsis nigrescens TaxID=381445 RepID=UPI000366312A|nr:NHL repeat-containing protein [Amycolatopsis nigrescens]